MQRKNPKTVPELPTIVCGKNPLRAVAGFGRPMHEPIVLREADPAAAAMHGLPDGR